LIRIAATNRGPEAAKLHLLPTLWFRNTWAWGHGAHRPELRASDDGPDHRLVRTTCHTVGTYWLACAGSPDLLFTQNASNTERLPGVPNRSPYVKDGIGEAVVHGQTGAVNPEEVGTKVAAHYVLTIAPGGTETIRLRLSHKAHDRPFAGFDKTIAGRKDEADAL